LTVIDRLKTELRVAFRVPDNCH